MKKREEYFSNFKMYGWSKIKLFCKHDLSSGHRHRVAVFVRSILKSGAENSKESNYWFMCQFRTKYGCQVLSKGMVRYNPV